MINKMNIYEFPQPSEISIDFLGRNSFQQEKGRCKRTTKIYQIRAKMSTYLTPMALCVYNGQAMRAMKARLSRYAMP